MKRLEELVGKVFAGDCLEVLKEVPDRSIDMVLCDLPYGLTNNPWDHVIDLELLWAEYRRVAKDCAAIVLTGMGGFTAKLIMSNYGMFKYKLAWIKSKPTNFLNARRQPLRRHEDICVFYNQQPVFHPQMFRGKPYGRGGASDKKSGSYYDFTPRRKVNFSGMRYPDDLLFFEDESPGDWIYIKGPEYEGPVLHPTQKPIALGRYLIRTYTDEGMVVLDNACGSGSFLAAAVLEGRQFIGIELNKGAFYLKVNPIDFIQLCKDRIEQAHVKRKEELERLKLF